MITVSIVTYKTSTEELIQCLKSLTSPLVSTIYIVDNSSQKYIADFCTQYPNVEYIGSENVGYGAGHNQALRKVLQTKEKYHLVLNSDVYFEPFVMDKLVKEGYAHNIKSAKSLVEKVKPEVWDVLEEVIYLSPASNSCKFDIQKISSESDSGRVKCTLYAEIR